MSTGEDTAQAWQELLKGIWKENPVFVAVLGLCPTMAVTNSLINGIVMGVATTFVLVGSSLLVSSLRKAIPKPVRISVFIIIIATFVTTADYTLAALLPAAHKQLGAFIALIVVNCIILGRQEAFASRHRVPLALSDAVGMSLGFTLALSLIGGVREVLGSGTLAGVPLFGPHYEPWSIMILPPGGFFTLGMLLMSFAWVAERRDRRRREAQAREPSPRATEEPRRAA